MIRTVCLAVLATGTVLMAQSASATVNVNGRVSQIVNGLRVNAQFSQRNFSLTLKGSKSVRLFSGIEDIRTLAGTDFKVLDDWAGAQPALDSVFNGAPYKFTHTVLGSFFGHDDDSSESGDAGSQSTGPVLGGAPSYKFTYSVLGSYFNNLPSSTPSAIVAASLSESPVPVESSTSLLAVPEPASWAMMIGGFALTGATLRRRHVAARLA